jgi:hypothetical protein
VVGTAEWKQCFWVDRGQFAGSLDVVIAATSAERVAQWPAQVVVEQFPSLRRAASGSDPAGAGTPGVRDAFPDENPSQFWAGQHHGSQKWQPEMCWFVAGDTPAADHSSLAVSPCKSLARWSAAWAVTGSFLGPREMLIGNVF